MRLVEVIFAAGALLAAATASTADTRYPPPRRCFFAGEGWNWRAPDGNTIFIRTYSNRYYRLDLAGECPELTRPDVHLITQFHGSDMLCAAVDWDLKVAEAFRGIPVPCIVKKMTALSPDQAAAIPPKYRP